MTKMSSLLQHTKTELRAAGMFADDADFDGAVGVGVTALMETLTAYGHSGASLDLTVKTFARLAAHLPLTPLTGEDDEWHRPAGDDEMEQNKRCHRVFRDGKMVWDVDKGYHPITFPYMPE
jgi:hypothetical protein